jgi:hypothetical protein
MRPGSVVEVEWREEALRLVFVGLTVWVLGGVVTFAGLSNLVSPGQLSGENMRSATLVAGFALGAVALLSYGTVRVLHERARVEALAVAVAVFLLPLVLEVAWNTWSRWGRTSLAPGLLALVFCHAAITAFRARRAAGPIDRVLVPEAALLLLGLGLAMADLGPGLALTAAR